MLMALHLMLVLFFCLFSFCLHGVLPTIVAIEGMAGAGKTTSLLQLVSLWKEKVVMLSELSPEPNSKWQNDSTDVQGDIYHQMWMNRFAILEQLGDEEACFLLDRSYITNLAFAYAFDKLTDREDYYSKHRALLERDRDINTDFDLVIVLDGTPDICLERRHRMNDEIPWPGEELKFLYAYREFYQNELPKLRQANVLYLNTDALTQEETLSFFKQAITPYLSNGHFEVLNVSEDDKKKLLAFGEKNRLGTVHSQPVYVLGYPTLYFRKHSVQLDEKGDLHLFNNRRLETIVLFRHSHMPIK
ncbi:MAG: deoxynucleoside kinase [Chlamydiia bacterium]|nr:deoxynucleoside kinase [Chlamydiia bacterium]